MELEHHGGIVEHAPVRNGMPLAVRSIWLMLQALHCHEAVRAVPPRG